MKLVTYSSNESVRCGLLTQAGLIDIASAWDGANPPTSVIEILQRGQDCLERVAGLAESAEVAAGAAPSVSGDGSSLLLAVQPEASARQRSAAHRSARITSAGRGRCVSIGTTM